jgi:hypothetical protein
MAVKSIVFFGEGEVQKEPGPSKSPLARWRRPAVVLPGGRPRVSSVNLSTPKKTKWRLLVLPEAFCKNNPEKEPSMSRIYHIHRSSDRHSTREM